MCRELGSKKKLNLVPIRCSLGSLREAEDCANTTIKLLSMIERKLDILMLNAGVAWVRHDDSTLYSVSSPIIISLLKTIYRFLNIGKLKMVSSLQWQSII